MTAQSSQGTALITAAAGTVGRAIAAALAPRWALVLQESPALSAEAEELARSLRQAGGTAAVIVADLADVAATGSIIARAAAALGPTTLLVNAATLFETDRGSFDANAWKRMIGHNLRVPWQLGEAFAAALPAQANGAIVHILDRRVWQRAAGARLYELSQATLAAATETMARAYAPLIRVNAVGPPKSVAVEGAIGIRSGMPLGALAADAIARAVLYLATAASVTGQVITIDPGNFQSPQIFSASLTSRN